MGASKHPHRAAALTLLAPGEVPLHRHMDAYATIVRRGSYTEFSVEGRFLVQAGVVILHPHWHLHADNVHENSEVWNVPLGRFAPDRVLHVSADGFVAGLTTTPTAEDLVKALAVGPASPRAPEAQPDWLAEDEDFIAAFSKTPRAFSREHAHRRFRQSFGMTPGVYRAERQLQRAISLIQAGLPLAECAMAGGYVDQSHMTRQFTRMLGQPPGRFRQAITAVQDRRANAD